MAADGSRRITRRSAIGGGVALGAGAALGSVPGAAGAKKPKGTGGRPRRIEADVCVVGAGFAGLTTALNLKRAGHSVVVLEARRRVGGRIWGHELPNGRISERGGTFVGPTQDRVLAALDRHGLNTFPTFNEGENVYVNSGERSTFSDTGPTGSAPPDPLVLPELAVTVAQLDEMSKKVPVDAPWTAPGAGDLDRQTLSDYIEAHAVSERFKRLLPAATRPIFGAEPDELSLLFVLFYIAASGNEQNPGTFERNFNTRNGAQESRIVGGSQRLGFRMAKALGKSRIVLGSPVRRIIQKRDGVKVVGRRAVVDAKYVVVAIPPTLAGRIDYFPKLPAARDALTQRLSQGQLTKVAAAYKKPFWREKGLNGSALSTDGLTNATFDDTPKGGDPGVIFAFVGGDASREFAALSEAQRRKRVLSEFAFYFGDEALEAEEFFYTQWPEQRWSRGGPVGIYPPGLMSSYGHRIRAPIGRIHWAGTETSTYWNGYMDGAIRSGERAALEVGDRL
jgi:monoamine oxidase